MPVAFEHAAFGGAHMCADQDQRQLIGEKFVIGQPHALGRGRVQIRLVRRSVRLAAALRQRAARHAL